MLEIREVLGRSDQGVTHPFICRASDGLIYYVKGRGTGYKSLKKEWAAGQLAKGFGLPIAPFEILNVPRELYELNRRALADLGYGPVFGSRKQEPVFEISMVERALVAPSLRADIAVFDWWIMNGDRTLSETGGNPNVLWSVVSSSLVVIDHNLAFDSGVTLAALMTDHIFGDALAGIVSDRARQQAYNERFQRVVPHLPAIIREMPEQWDYLDDMQTVAVDFTEADAAAVLQRFMDASFWRPS
jgi:hypothetical protein